MKCPVCGNDYKPWVSKTKKATECSMCQKWKYAVIQEYVKHKVHGATQAYIAELKKLQGVFNHDKTAKS